MKITVAGLGLIGGSYFKAAKAAGYEVEGAHHGDKCDFSSSDVVIVAMPPRATEEWLWGHKGDFKPGALVFDVCGVKKSICEKFERPASEFKWHFIPSHPMAGREKGGFSNSTADLFAGASMILVPFDFTPDEAIDKAKALFLSLGFKQVVLSSPERHDEMIAYTSQLCHLISSAYVREPLSEVHDGFSAGSFRDMVRVGAPDPEIWTELFFTNRSSLLDVLERYIGRLEAFRDALSTRDAAAMKRMLEEGTVAKAKILANTKMENLR